MRELATLGVARQRGQHFRTTIVVMRRSELITPAMTQAEVEQRSQRGCKLLTALQTLACLGRLVAVKQQAPFFEEPACERCVVAALSGRCGLTACTRCSTYDQPARNQGSGTTCL